MSVYISCAGNRTPNCVDWGFNNYILYAACNSVAIYLPKKPSCVTQVLTGHSKRVNCVKFVGSAGKISLKNIEETEIVSGSADNLCIIWSRQVDGKYQEITRLTGHNGSITAIDAFSIYNDNGQRTVIVTASVDSTVKIWQRSNKEEFTCVQTIGFGGGFALNVALTVLPDSDVVMLACAGDDQKIHIFLETNGQFVSVETLLGHEDWVRGLSFATDENGDVLLASCSQDLYIRIWRFSSRNPSNSSEKSIAQLSLQDDIKLKENTFCFKKCNDESACFAVKLESVLQGHENWIYSIKWQPKQLIDGIVHQPMCLLSASMDKTMIIWKPDSSTGIWFEYARVGEAGGNSLGFYGGLFSPDGLSILSHGYQGAFELRTLNQETNIWEPQVTCGGHYDSVHDIAWQPQTANFLLSVSSDQTTRCHGYWKSKDQSEQSWHEVARPQIHGYDMQCITMINRYMFASGADEKVVRCFEAPKNFVETLSKISAIDLSKDIKSRPQGAAVPCLGLSNKAVFEDSVENLSGGHEVESHPNEQYPENYYVPVDTQQPPSEVDLLQNTLWPEIHKLYGHGYEIFALACNPQGTCLASSCKAAKADHAGILLWEVGSWKVIDTLLSHSLTVTQLEFSHSGQYLLSVSRDRTWSLFQNTGKTYKRITYTDKKTCIHSRIIWSCAWSHDDLYFVTVSRDKKAIIWKLADGQQAKDSCGGQCVMAASITLEDSITAVDFAPISLSENRYVLAFGYDNGCILLYTWSSCQLSWIKHHTFNNSEAHHLTVKRLKFRPIIKDSASENTVNCDETLHLASCGADHLVRIYEINTKQFEECS